MNEKSPLSPRRRKSRKLSKIATSKSKSKSKLSITSDHNIIQRNSTSTFLNRQWMEDNRPSCPPRSTIINEIIKNQTLLASQSSITTVSTKNDNDADLSSNDNNNIENNNDFSSMNQSSINLLNPQRAEDLLEYKINVLSCINNREALLNRCKERLHEIIIIHHKEKKYVEHSNSKTEKKRNQLHHYVLLQRLINGLRDASLYTVEAIVEWSSILDQENASDSYYNQNDLYNYEIGASNNNSIREIIIEEDDAKGNISGPKKSNGVKSNALKCQKSLKLKQESQQQSSSLSTSSNNFDTNIRKAYFRWKNQNYITKMLTDCMFLEDAIINEIIGDTNFTAYRNPFLLPSYYAIDQIFLRRHLRHYSRKDESIIDYVRIKEASLAIINEELRVKNKIDMEYVQSRKYSDNTTCMKYMTNVIIDNNVSSSDKSSISYDRAQTSSEPKRFLPPVLNLKDMKDSLSYLNNSSPSSQQQPPLILALVISCLRVLLQCDKQDNILNYTTIPPLTSQRVYHLLRRSMKPVVNKLRIFDYLDYEEQIKKSLLKEANNKTATSSSCYYKDAIVVLYPIVTHEKLILCRDVIGKICLESLGDLTSWMIHVVTKLYDDHIQISSSTSKKDDDRFEITKQSILNKMPDNYDHLIKHDENSGDGFNNSNDEKDNGKGKRRKKKYRDDDMHNDSNKKNLNLESIHDDGDPQKKSNRNTSASRSKQCNAKRQKQKLLKRQNKTTMRGKRNRTDASMQQDEINKNDLCHKLSLNAKIEDEDHMKKDNDFTGLVLFPLPFTVSVKDGSTRVKVICSSTFHYHPYNKRKKTINDKDGIAELHFQNFFDRFLIQGDKVRFGAFRNKDYEILQSISLSNNVDCPYEFQLTQPYYNTNTRTDDDNVQIWKLISSNDHDDMRYEWRKQFDHNLIPWQTSYMPLELTHFFHVPIPSWDLLENLCQDNIMSSTVYYKNEDEDTISEKLGLFMLHQQRVYYFTRVGIKEIIQKTYDVVCNIWNPTTSSAVGIDIVKWSRLARKMKFISNVKNTNHEIDMLFIRLSKNERKVDDINVFEAMLRNIAILHFPSLKETPEKALSELIFTTVALIPQINSFIWSKAQTLMITNEAKNMCAQIRLGTWYRRIYYQSLYQQKKRSTLLLQKQIRKWLKQQRWNDLMHDVRHTWIKLCYTKYVITCQCYVRRFLTQIKYELLLKELRVEQRKKILHSLKCRRKIIQDRTKLQTKIFRKMHWIPMNNSTSSSMTTHKIPSLVTMFLHSTGSSNDNYHPYYHCLEIVVYLPTSKETFAFMLNEEKLKEFAYKVLRINTSAGNTKEDSATSNNPSPSTVLLSWNEILQPKILYLLLQSNVKLSMRRQKPVVLFSKCFRGKLLDKRCIRTNIVGNENNYYIICIYKSSWEICITCSNTRNSFQVETCITLDMLSKWFTKYYNDKNGIKDIDVENDSVSQQSHHWLLYPEHEDILVTWIIHRIKILPNRASKSEREEKYVGKVIIKLNYNTEEELFELSAILIQSLWRRFVARCHALSYLYKYVEKVFSRETQTYYYFNTITSESSNVKPYLLHDDDLDLPKDEWKQHTTTIPAHEQQSAVSTYYYNPATGQTSYISPEMAAKTLQRIFRNKQSLNLLGTKMSMANVVKALKFINDTEQNYFNGEDKISLLHMVNYALLCHCIKFDFVTAKKLYEEAVEQSPTHPVILRSYGIFLLSSSSSLINDKIKNPLIEHSTTAIPNFILSKVKKMFHTAKDIDPSLEYFHNAQEHFFHWSVVCNPRHVLALLNYALMYQYVVEDYYHADRIYRYILTMVVDDNICGSSVSEKRPCCSNKENSDLHRSVVISNYDVFLQQWDERK